MSAAIDTAVDVALWFADQALNGNEYLQPQKLQRLLFLSQAYYAVAFSGRMLMPAIFVADDMGPIEPNIFKVFAQGRPDVESDLFLPEQAEQFLNMIWRRFGHHSAEHLTRMVKDSEAYQRALKKGRRTEITLDAMRLSFTRAKDTPAIDQIMRPKMLRSQTGKAVTVKSWTPNLKPARPR